MGFHCVWYHDLEETSCSESSCWCALDVTQTISCHCDSYQGAAGHHWLGGCCKRIAGVSILLFSPLFPNTFIPLLSTHLPTYICFLRIFPQLITYDTNRNALDAGATQIQIKLEGDGLAMIQVFISTNNQSYN